METVQFARSRVVDPELFVSDPTPDLTFKEDSARPDSGSGSCFRSGNAGLRLNGVSYLSVNVFETKVFSEIFLEKIDFSSLGVHLVEKLRILSEKFCFKFIQVRAARIRIRNDLFRILQRVSDPTPDPQYWQDPSKPSLPLYGTSKNHGKLGTIHGHKIFHHCLLASFAAFSRGKNCTFKRAFFNPPLSPTFAILADVSVLAVSCIPAAFGSPMIPCLCSCS